MTDPVAHAHREHWGRLLAVLVARHRRLDLAEDVLAEAFARATATWTPESVPDNPAAWLLTVASRAAVDQLRREEVVRRHQPLLMVDAAVRERAVGAADVLDELEPAPLRDEQLRMVFLAAHPALAPESAAALALRLVLGLSTDTIAELFLVSAATMSARLTRAKKRIARAGIPFALPEGDALASRIDHVCRVVYLCFTAGYAPPAGQELLDPALSGEAIRLGRLVVELLPDQPAPAATLAVMVLHHSRRDARVDHRGNLVLLDDQDRSRWHRREIDEGRALVRRAGELIAGPGAPEGSGGRSGRRTIGGFAAQMYLQGCIAAEHARAAGPNDVDWTAISRLYEQLDGATGSPVVRLNRAVALARADGPASGLALLDGLDQHLPNNHRLHAVRADLLERIGDRSAAARECRRSIELCGNVAERRHLAGVLRRLGG